MKEFVCWTGVLSLVAGVTVEIPGATGYLMPQLPGGLLLQLFGLMAMFLGIMLIVCSRDLRRRGTLVAWEGLLRLAGGSVILYHGLFGGQGWQAVVAGGGDALIGLAYVSALPRYLQVSWSELFLDRLKEPAGAC